MDPRVRTPRAGLEEQLTLSMRLHDAIGRVFDQLPAQANTAPRRGPGAATDPLRRLQADLLTAYDALQEVDVAPTAAVRRTVEELIARADECCAR
jgi:hypothetical protein